MRDEFTMPGFSKLGDLSIETHELECAVEIEPDESVGCTDWYIARVYVEGYVKRKRQWFAVPATSPLFETVKAWAMDERDAQLAELWSEYLDDKPRTRRRAAANADEHRTHGGSL